MESNHNFKNIKDYLVFWDIFFEEWKKDKKGTFNKDVIWKNRKGKGKTELEYDVLPQPYLGNIRDHSVITLNLNPSRSKKNKENIEFEENYLPKFKEKKNYYEYAESFPTYDTHPFWKKQIDWIDRIFEKLGKETPSKNPEPLKPFAIEICPWGSHSFQKLKIDTQMISYLDKNVFDIIKKVNKHSKFKIVLSVGKAYYDFFEHKKSGFKLEEEISNLKNCPKNWPRHKRKNHLYNRHFSIWTHSKSEIKYFNTYAPGSNSTPGVHFDEIQNDLIKRHLQKNQ